MYTRIDAENVARLSRRGRVGKVLGFKAPHFSAIGNY